MLVEDLEIEMPDLPPTVPAPRAEVIAEHEQGVAHAAARLAEWWDDGLAATWRLSAGGRFLMESERGDALRAILFNQTCHHRGQLTVYLRLLDIPVPAIYGPSADENPFG